MYVVEIRSTFQNYRQPQKSNQESTTLKPKYYHQQKRRMLEDLVDPSLLNKLGGTLQVINSTLLTFFVSRKRTKMKILSYHLNHSYISQVPLQGISGRRPKSAYELLSSAADPPRRSKNYPLTSGYQTSYTPYVPYR